MDDVELRALVPQVLSVLVRRGADFATAEDAVQEALVRALDAWEENPPSDPKGWLVTVAWRAFIDLARSDAARRDREVEFAAAEPTGVVPSVDDTLGLYFSCAHPELTPSSAVALTLRAVGGLTTRQIAQAYLVPESTMAQRISRAKRTVGGAGLGRVGDVRTVMRVLYLVFNEGHSGEVDLAAEAIRLTRQLVASVDDPEIDGLLALMLLHHARRRSRTRPDGTIVPLAEQDRSQWDGELITEGIAIVQAALACDRLGEYQAQAAIAALHADAPRFEDTDWVQIVEVVLGLAGLLLGRAFCRAASSRGSARPRRLAGHLRVDGRPRRVGEPGREVAFVHREERLERLQVVVDAGPRVAVRVGARRAPSRSCSVVGVDRVELVPGERRRHLPAGPGARRPRAEHGLVRRVLVEVDEHPLAAFFLPPRVGEDVGPAARRARAPPRPRPSGPGTRPNAVRGARRRGCRGCRSSSDSPSTPSSSSSVFTSRAAMRTSVEADAGLRVEVEAQLVGVLGVGGAVRPHVEPEAAEVHRPHEVREVGGDQRARRRAVRRADDRRLEPLGRVVGHALLEERRARRAVREPLHEHRPALHRAA